MQVVNSSLILTTPLATRCFTRFSVTVLGWVAPTVKLAALVAEPPVVVTLIFPVVAPVGTVAVILVSELMTKAAITPLKVTGVAPQELRRSYAEWMERQGLDVQALPICITGNDRFYATAAARRTNHQDPTANLDDRAVFFSTVAEFEEQMLAELRALHLADAADRARMDAFVPLAQDMIELHRQQAAAAAAGHRARVEMWRANGSI